MASDRPSSEVADVLDVDGVGVGVGGLGGGQQEAEPGSTVLSSENFSRVWFFIFVISLLSFNFIGGEVNEDDDLEVIFNTEKQKDRAQGEQSYAPLDLHVSPALIAKIREKKYVPLGQLIDSIN